MNPAQRAAAYAAQARSAADARGTTKVEPNAIEAGQPGPQQTRDWWTVYPWGASAYPVLVRPAQTQREMRDLYPEAAGIIAA